MLVMIECCVFVGSKTVEDRVIKFFFLLSLTCSLMCDVYILILKESDMQMY